MLYCARQPLAAFSGCASLPPSSNAGYHASLETAAGRFAPCQLPARFLTPRRRLVPHKVRQYACALHGKSGGTRSAMAQGAGPGLDHGRIWHAAARDLGPDAPRSVNRTPIRAKPGNSTLDRPRVAGCRRPSCPWRAADHGGLRCVAGRRWHAHRGHYRLVGRASRLLSVDARTRHGQGWRAEGSCRGGFLRHL